MPDIGAKCALLPGKWRLQQIQIQQPERHFLDAILLTVSAGCQCNSMKTPRVAAQLMAHPSLDCSRRPSVSLGHFFRHCPLPPHREFHLPVSLQRRRLGGRVTLPNDNPCFILIREAIDELHGPTRQIVKLFSLGYKVREISEFEEANGRSSSPRVVTVRLHRAKERLRENLKRKGMGLTVVPFSWLRRVSLRLRILGDRFWQLTPFVETSQVFETALVFVLSSGLLLPGAGIKGLSSGVRASNTTSVAFMLLNPATPSVDAEANRVGQGVRRQGDFLQANSGQSDASVRSPLRLEENEHRPAVARTVPVETPDKEASDSPSVPKEIIIHTPTGGTLDAREYRPDQDGKPAPPLPNQARDLVEDPSQISLPRCGGIAICDDLPNTIGDLAKP